MDCKQEYIVPKDKNYNILVIEDSDFINKRVVALLSKNSNYNVNSANSFESAQVLLAQEDYDFIILDLNLPDAFGEELLMDVRSLTNAKVIVLTAETDVQIRSTLFRLGAIDYIVKDRDFSSSIKFINRAISTVEKNRNDAILIVEDSKLMSKQLQKILDNRNYSTLIAHNAKEALNILNENKISTILLDMELPDMHGIELLRRIKEIDRICNIPVIVVSASNDPENISNALKYGAFNFIKKPFDVEELVLKIDMSVEINRKRVDLLCSQAVLQEYKEAVDEGSIVSKTDVKGIITYVNDKFCEISGYSRDELIGKAHNIVRHPDMPSLKFKELWETIKDKKTWKGIIKNLKKNGGEYYVQSTIKPIVDYNGNIVEFIAIRTDITQREKYRKILEKNLEVSSNNLKYLAQYEKAISEFVAIFKTDTKNDIIYVNDNFCKLSGYSKEELIGKNCSEIRARKHVLRGDCGKIIKALAQKKTLRMLFENVSKDGKTYYTDTKVFPLVDPGGAVSEQLFLMYDVTEIVNIHKELEDTQKDIIYKMGEIGESRSKETGNHVKRVANYSRVLAKLAGLDEKDINTLYAASPMHDIGKVGIPDSILNKPGKLTEEEFEIMKTHASIGYEILKNSKRPILRAAAIVSYTHHEKWDGSGYPRGLRGEEIDIFGRITALADVFDALGSNRPYKKAWGLERILKLIKNERGKHFDPKLVDLFLDNIDQFLEIREKYKDA